MISIKRKSSPIYAMSGFRVYVDGKKIGELRPGEVFEADVPPGLHRLSVRTLFTSSNELAIETGKVKRLHFTAEPFSSGFFKSFIQLSQD